MSNSNQPETATDKKTLPAILMCPPRHFEVTYEINQWMQPETWKQHPEQFKEMAASQWQNLYQTFKSANVAVEIVEPAEGLPDMVFTANSAIVLDGKVLLANFLYQERQPEEELFSRYFKNCKEKGIFQSVQKLPKEFFQEGAGDCIWDARRQLFWAGYGPRSSKEAAQYIEQYFGKKVIALELLSSRFYHLDLSLSPLSNGEIIYYPEAFSENSRKLIEEIVEADKLITLSKEDAFNFVCNLVNIGDKIILSRCSDELKTLLTSKGYSVILSPVDQFGLAGGAVCCLTLKLNMQSKS